MEHQFIKKGVKCLYSVYHESAAFKNEEVGVILCYPFGQEYIRCHKLYVTMADRLATQGYHTLRFDYSGTGDSSGEFSSTTLSSCMDDISLAITELKESCGVTKIVLIGVRIGATLSLLYSKKFKVESLILWNPIIDGFEYLKHIKNDYNMWLAGSFAKERKLDVAAFSNFGFCFSNELTSEIKLIKFLKTDFPETIPILLIGENNPFNTIDIQKLTFEKSINKEFWLKRENEMEKSMVPNYELNKILLWIQQTALND